MKYEITVDELISKQEALDTIARVGVFKHETKEVQAVAECLREVEKLQPATPKPETVTEFADRCRECGKMRTGHWITKNRLYPKCDKCGWEYGSSITKFCPDCGARMEVKKNE